MSQSPPESSPPASPGASPWVWVPSLYFAQGLPNVIVITVSAVMLKRLGVSNTDLALYTSWLHLPWVIKPLWSPLIDLFGTKRRWVLAMQGAIGASLGLLAFTLPGPFWLQSTIALLWTMAFASATHDIAADGLYMLGLTEGQQASFAGVRSTFYRLAMVSGEGLLVVLAGALEQHLDPHQAWAGTMGVASVVFLLVFLAHAWMLPSAAADRPVASHGFAHGFTTSLTAFLAKPRLGAALAFLLLYRFAEAQLVKMIAPFLLDPRELGGLGLTTSEVGWAKGTFGVLALLAGGILGGVVISRDGLKAWLWPMALILHVPDLVFVALAWFQPESFPLICAAIAAEQFGYGFGFSAYGMYLIHLADGEHKTTHYALGTGVMAAGMMVPGMWSGALEEQLGYTGFFLWVVLATVPGFWAVSLIRVPDDFGRRAG